MRLGWTVGVVGLVVLLGPALAIAQATAAAGQPPGSGNAAAGAGGAPAGGEAGAQATVETRLSAVEAEVANFKKTGISEPWALVPSFNNGLQLKANNGEATLKIGGRVQLDSAWFAEDGEIESDFGGDPGVDGAEFRRARIVFSGELWKHFEYKAEYDFAGVDPADTPGFRDVYGGLYDLPVVGSVRVGHYKEPFGLEELTSSNYITFMERSLTSAFTPARNDGVMAHNTICEDSGTWAIGVFRPTEDQTAFGQGDGDYSITGRVTHLPWYEEPGTHLLHIGGAITRQGAEGNVQRYSARPSAHLADRLVDTRITVPMMVTDLQVNADVRTGLEAALVLGPLSFQGELMSTWANGIRGDEDLSALGYYVMVSYFLTGEHRPYDREAGVFSRVKPKSNFLAGDGCGAWELAARYSFLDLDVDSELGAAFEALHDVTVGVNWYWNPIFRVMLNYVVAHPEGSGYLHVAELRFQVAF
jgi:phosphate-selective porin OprO/OprP